MLWACLASHRAASASLSGIMVRVDIMNDIVRVRIVRRRANICHGYSTDFRAVILILSFLLNASDSEFPTG